MKEVRAYIKPHKRSVVVDALNLIEGLTGLTVLHAHGRGRIGSDDTGEPPVESGFLEPHEKVEVVCRDDLVGDVVAAIEQAAHTGLRGDGKIYVVDIEEAVRVATGERGEDAV